MDDYSSTKGNANLIEWDVFMPNRIVGSEYQLGSIFSKEFTFFIPSYQRPYAWEKEQTQELIEDLYSFYCSEDSDSYFLGSIVLIKKEDTPEAQVIDGQQRLTTLTILLAVLASKLSGDDRTEYEDFIIERGKKSLKIEPHPRLTIRDIDNDFFQKYVHQIKIDELINLTPSSLKTEAQQNLRNNAEVIKNFIESNIGASEDKIMDFGQFLVTRCFLVAVSTPSQDSAFRVFSVLNSRGLDLLPTDIIKAELIGKIPSKKQKKYTELWESLEIYLGRAGFADLFGHIRMIFTKEKAKAKLLDEFRKNVIPTYDKPEDVIDEGIAPYADMYQKIKHSDCTQKKANDALVWLNKLDNSDWIPPAIEFLVRHSNPKYIGKFFVELERLAAYMHICAKNINYRIDRYAELLEELEEENSLSDPVSAVQLTKQEKKEFKEALKGNIYDKLTARRRNYLILRLDSYSSDASATYDPEVLTVEHVLPQTVDPDSEWEKLWPDEEEREDWLHKVANLVPLARRKNSSAQNYDFAIKKDKYFTGKSKVSSYALTTEVLHTDSWTPAIVKARQKILLARLYELWDLE
jgi:hypothetical protein